MHVHMVDASSSGRRRWCLLPLLTEGYVRQTGIQTDRQADGQMGRDALGEPGVEKMTVASRCAG